MTELTKKQKKHLRLLAGQCYEKEMSLALEKLYENFQKWKKSEITAWDLNDKIHEHHDLTARELWKTYEQMNDSGLAVAFALAKGIISIEDVDDDCRELVERKSDVYELKTNKGSTTNKDRLREERAAILSMVGQARPKRDVIYISKYLFLNYRYSRC